MTTPTPYTGEILITFEIGWYTILRVMCVFKVYGNREAFDEWQAA